MTVLNDRLRVGAEAGARARRVLPPTTQARWHWSVETPVGTRWLYGDRLVAFDERSGVHSLRRIEPAGRRYSGIAAGGRIIVVSSSRWGRGRPRPARAVAMEMGRNRQRWRSDLPAGRNRRTRRGRSRSACGVVGPRQRHLATRRGPRLFRVRHGRRRRCGVRRYGARAGANRRRSARRDGGGGCGDRRVRRAGRCVHHHQGRRRLLRPGHAETALDTRNHGRRVGPVCGAVAGGRSRRGLEPRPPLGSRCPGWPRTWSNESGQLHAHGALVTPSGLFVRNAAYRAGFPRSGDWGGARRLVDDARRCRSASQGRPGSWPGWMDRPGSSIRRPLPESSRDAGRWPVDSHRFPANYRKAARQCSPFG